MAYGANGGGQIVIQWPDDKIGQIKDALTRARKKREDIASEYDWSGNRDRYVPKPQKLSDGTVSYDVNVGADFRDVERKKAALLYDTPSVTLMADEPSRPLAQPQQPGQPVPTMGSLVSMHQELINGLLGPRHANAKPVMLKALFDVLCPAGVGVFKVGYETRTVPVDAPQMDPMGQPAINPVTGQPLTQPVDLPIWEKWFISRISPMGLLLPADFKDTDHTLAPWIGYDYCVPMSAAKRMFGLAEDWKPRGTDAKKPYFDAEDEQQYTASDPPVLVTYVEYKAEHYADAGTPVHPEQINQMCFVDGELVKHQPHPDQTIDPQSARLTLDSITSFSVQTLTLRDYSDAAWVASDSTVTGALTREVNKYRTITVKQRDGQRHIILYDPSKLTADARAKVDKGDVSTWVPVEPGSLDQNPDGVMHQVTTIQQGRESYVGQDYIERDRDRILGMEQNQTGSTTPTKRTATELTLVQRNSEARFEQERQRVLECYLRLVRIFDCLVLRYCDERNASLILGPIKGRVWAQYKQALLGGYHYELQVDSAKYMDVEAERRNWLQFYNLTAKDPNANRTVVLKKLAGAWGLDPAEWVVEKLPEPKPEPPKINFTVSAADLNPTLPHFPLVVQLLRQGGIDLGITDVQLAQMQAQSLGIAGRSPVTGEQEKTETPDPNNPLSMIESLSGPSQVPTAGVGPDPKKGRPMAPEGPAEPADRLNQHQLNLTGGLSGPGPM